MRAIAIWALALASGLATACATAGPGAVNPDGGVQGDSRSADAAVAATGAKPTIFTIVLENHDYAEIVGSKNAPYINSLIAKYGLATNYSDTGHPSLPNYLHLISGANQYSGSDRDPTTSPFPVDQPNLGTQLQAAGIRWRSYQESMGKPCELSGSGNYAPKHDPFLYFTDMQNGANGLCAATNVPYSQFAADLASNDYRYMWITPNLVDDGHNPYTDPVKGLQDTDSWLSHEVKQILDSDGYKAGGVLFITWDEAEGRNGDAKDRIPMIVISPRLRAAGMKVNTAYDHSSYLATVEDLLGLRRLATVKNATSMMAFFQQSGGPDAGAPPDAAPRSPDAAAPDAAPPPDAGNAQQPDHLLLTEIRAAGSDEFIEIDNPTASTVALDHYYLTDMQAYPQLPAGTPATVSSDFMAKFPSGATIAPKQVIVVALRANDFAQTYGKAPDYGVVDATGATAMVPVVVGGSASLTNTGEMVALFYWDGKTDLVSDVDLVEYGSGISASNRLPNKTGVSVDGPDSGTTASTYKRDAYTITPVGSTASGSTSYKRIALEAGHETATGGNGITGHDETSEDTQVTWDTGNTAATPGTVPAAIDP